MNYSDPSNLIFYLTPSIYAICIMLMYIFDISPENIVNFISKKLAQKDHLTKIDFEKTKKYYTDILYNHSIIELSYIDDFEINLKREIVSTLLSLELKKKIKITDTQIEIINEDDTDLKLTEKDVFHCIENGKVKIANVKEFQDLLQYHAVIEGIESGLLFKMNEGIKWLKRRKLFICLSLILIIATLVLYKCYHAVTFEFDSGKISLNTAYIYTGVYTFFMPIYMIYVTLVADIFRSYEYKMRYTYERTSRGDTLNERIEGLKKYIKEYSLLDEKEREALILWDEYLIYSVEFNQNKEVLKKMSDLIELRDPSKLMPFTRKEMAVTVAVFILFGLILFYMGKLSIIILPIILVIYIIFMIKNNQK